MKSKSHKAKALWLTLAIILLPTAYLLRHHWMPFLQGFTSETEVVASPSKTKTKDSKVGKTMDTHRGIAVYYNGRVSAVHGRNTTGDGYNLGLKYQCVEFVKRYYYERLGHAMPNSYGHAREFFDASVPDGGFNSDRGLKQFTNPGKFKPTEEAILVYGPTKFNAFGHVAIVTDVGSDKLSCISQNLGVGNGTRRTYALEKTVDGLWRINEPYVVGWLSK